MSWDFTMSHSGWVLGDVKGFLYGLRAGFSHDGGVGQGINVFAGVNIVHVVLS